MSYNGGGSFSIDTPLFPFTGHTIALSQVVNAVLVELAGGLSLAICRDGQSVITGNISLNSHRLTNVLAGTALTDAATLQNIIQHSGTYVASVGGTVDAITLTPSPAISSLGAGTTFWFIATGANTGAATVTVAGQASKSITKLGATALAAGNIKSGALVGIMYDGTQFQMISPIG